MEASFEFRMAPDGYKRAMRKLWLRHLVSFPLILLIVMGVNYYMNGHLSTTWESLPFTFLILEIFSFRSEQKRLKGLHESYVLSVDEENFTRYQEDMPTLVIPRSEITEIDTFFGMLRIKGEDRKNSIIVSPHIENREHLIDILSGIKPVATKPVYTVVEKLEWALIIPSFVVVLVLFISANTILVALSGTFICGLILWSLIGTNKLKNMPIQFQRIKWITLVLIPVVLFRVYMQWTGMTVAELF